MPEGPEVKNLVKWLNKDLAGEKIKKVIVHGGRYKKQQINNLNKIIFPLSLDRISCHGKFIYWTFKKSDIVLFNTLGMTGWWIYEKEKHSNIEFILNTESIYFNDYRNFGTLSFCNQQNLEKKLKELGPDILDNSNPDNNYQLFLQRLERKRNDTLIATALLDQKVVAGCGNYLRAECLYIAKISPFREISKLSKIEVKKIWDILRQLAWYYYDEKQGIKLGIINDNILSKLFDKYKKSGPSKYKPKTGSFLVYRQDKDPNGYPVLTETINNRTIHYVKQIQK